MITTKKMTKKKKPTNSMSAKPKNSLLKTLEEHKPLTFQNYRLEKRLLQELSQKMSFIMSNASNSEIFLFIKCI